MSLSCPVKSDGHWLYHVAATNYGKTIDAAAYLWDLNDGNNLRVDFKGDENPIYIKHLNAVIAENGSGLTPIQSIGILYGFNKLNFANLDANGVEKLKSDLSETGFNYTIKYSDEHGALKPKKQSIRVVDENGITVPMYVNKFEKPRHGQLNQKAIEDKAYLMTAHEMLDNAEEIERAKDIYYQSQGDPSELGLEDPADYMIDDDYEDKYQSIALFKLNTKTPETLENSLILGESDGKSFTISVTDNGKTYSEEFSWAKVIDPDDDSIVDLLKQYKDKHGKINFSKKQLEAVVNEYIISGEMKVGEYRVNLLSIFNAMYTELKSKSGFIQVVNFANSTSDKYIYDSITNIIIEQLNEKIKEENDNIKNNAAKVNARRKKAFAKAQKGLSALTSNEITYFSRKTFEEILTLIDEYIVKNNLDNTYENRTNAYLNYSYIEKEGTVDAKLHNGVDGVIKQATDVLLEKLLLSKKNQLSANDSKKVETIAEKYSLHYSPNINIVSAFLETYFSEYEGVNLQQSKVIMGDSVDFNDILNEEQDNEDIKAASVTNDEVDDFIELGEGVSELFSITPTQIDPKTTASAIVKRSLFGIKSSLNQLDEHGIEKTFDSSFIMEQLYHNLNGLDTIDKMIEWLIQNKENYGYIQEILNKLEDETYKSLFFVTFNKDRVTFANMFTKDTTKAGKVNILNPKYKVSNDILTSISNELAQRGSEALFKINEDGVFEDNIEKDKLVADTIMQHAERQSIIEKYSFKDLIKPEISAELNEYINAYLKFFDLDLLYAIDEYTESPMERRAFLNKLSTAYTGISKASSTWNLFGSLLNTKVGKSLLELERKSKIAINGKNYYPFKNTSLINKMFSTINDIIAAPKFYNNSDAIRDSKSKLQGYVQERFEGRFYRSDNGKIISYRDTWLKIMNGELGGIDAYEGLDFALVNSPTFNGIEYKKLSRQKYTSALINAYFSVNQESKFNEINQKTAYYRVPIYENKNAMEFINGPRIPWIYQKDSSSDAYIINDIDRIKLTEQFKDLIKQEIDRIVGMKTIGDNIISGDFQKNKNKFLNAPYVQVFLNENENIKNRISELIDNYSVVNYNTVINEETGYTYDTVIQIIAEAMMEHKFENFYNSLMDSGVLSITEQDGVEKIVVQDDLEFLYDIAHEFVDDIEAQDETYSEVEAIRDVLKDYYYNSFLANANIFHMTFGDIAHVGNATKAQKRYPQVYASTLKGNVQARDSKGNLFSENGKELSITINDFNDGAVLLKEAINAIEKTSYSRVIKNEIIERFKEINTTDGWSISTLKGLRTKYGIFGRWNNEMQDVYERIQKGESVNDAELSVLWSPLKPFLVSRHNIYDSEGNIITTAPISHKNSEFLMFLGSQAIYNAEDSKFKQLLEWANANNLDKIAFESAVKTGGFNNIEIDWNKDIKAQLNILAKNKINEIPLEDYGIITEVNEHFVDSEGLIGSQIIKLIQQDIPTAKKYVDEISGLIDDNVQESLIKLLNEINASALSKSIKDGSNSDDVVAVKRRRNTAISKMIFKEFKSNPSRYNAQITKAIVVDEETGEFTIPLSESALKGDIQSLLLAVIKKRITKQKIKGGNLVLASSFGLSEQLSVVKNKQGGVDHFEAYVQVPSAELYSKLVEEDGTINIDKKNPDGTLIYPHELRYMIGYRIPTECYASMTPIKIKGFLPSNSGSAIMLPFDIIAMSGADFDIDKLYTMSYEMSYNKHSNTFNKIAYDASNKSLNKRPQRNNRIVDIMLDVLQSPEALDELVNPSHFMDLEKLKKDIIALKGLTSEEDFFDPTTQIDFHQRNMIAGELIGLYANYNSAHAILQGLDEVALTADGADISSLKLFGRKFVEKGIIDLNKEYERLTEQEEKSGISNLTKKQKVSYNIKQFLAASVDATKNPILNTLNLTRMTSNIAMLLIKNGYSISESIYFLNHPAIVELAKRFTNEENTGKASVGAIISGMRKEISKSNEKTTFPSKVNLESISMDNISTAISGSAGDSNYWKKDGALFSLSMLKAFELLHNKSSHFQKLIYQTKSNTQGNSVGGTLEMSMQKMLKYNEIDGSAAFTKKTLDSVKGNRFMQTYVDASNDAMNAMFSDIFPQYIIGNKASDYFKVLETLMSKMDNPPGEKLLKKLFEHFQYYKMYNKLKSDNFLNLTLEELKNPKKIVESLPKGLNKFVEIDTRKVDTIKVTSSVNQRLIDNFNQALKEGLTAKDKNAYKLISLFFNTYGLADHKDNIIKYLSIENKELIDGYYNFFSSEFNNVNQISSQLEIERFIKKFKRHEYKSSAVVPNLSTKNLDKSLYKPLDDGIQFNVSGSSNALSVLYKEAGLNLSIKDFIVVDNQLYELITTKSIKSSELKGKIPFTLTYKKTSPLSINGKFLQYGDVILTEKKPIDGEIDIMDSTDLEDGEEMFDDYEGEVWGDEDNDEDDYQSIDIDLSNALKPSSTIVDDIVHSMNMNFSEKTLQEFKQKITNFTKTIC